MLCFFFLSIKVYFDGGLYVFSFLSCVMFFIFLFFHFVVSFFLISSQEVILPPLSLSSLSFVMLSSSISKTQSKLISLFQSVLLFLFVSFCLC